MSMKTRRWPIAVTALVLVVGPAPAKNVLIQVTPANVAKQPKVVGVVVKDAGQLKQFDITLRLSFATNFNPIEPHGSLSIAGRGGKTEPVLGSSSRGEVTYSIKIAPEDLDKASFTFTENTQDPQQPFPYPGETYTFRLKDFATAADAAKR